MNEKVIVKFETTKEDLSRIRNSLNSDIKYYNAGIQHLADLKAAYKDDHETYIKLREEYGINPELTIEGINLRYSETVALVVAYRQLIQQIDQVLNSDEDEIVLTTKEIAKDLADKFDKEMTKD